MTTRAGHEFIVVSPLSEYKSLRETMYLMNSPTNTRRLMASVAPLEQHIHKAGGGRFLYPKAVQMLSDKETAPGMGDDSMYMSLLNVMPVDRLDFDQLGSP